MRLPSLRRRLRGAMIVTSATSLLVVCVTLLAYEHAAFKRVEAQSLATLARSIAINCTAILLYGDPKRGDEYLASLKTEPAIVDGALYDKSGHLFSFYPSTAPPSQFPKSPGPDGLEFSGLNLTIVQPAMQDEGRMGTIVIHEDLHGMYGRFGLYAVVVALVMAAAIGLAYLISDFFQRRISQPILNLASVARRISEKNDFSVRVENSSVAEEIDLLNKAFNDMLEQIHSRDISLEQARAALEQHAKALETRVAERTRSLEETTRQLYDFCYSVAHDLKAPIRSQAGYARILIQDFSQQLGPEATEYAERIAAAADRQDRLVSDLLTHVSLGRSEMPMESVDLALLAEQVKMDLTGEIQRLQATVNLTDVKGAVVANRSSLNLVMINLFTNALKFIPRGRTPQVKAWTEVRDGCIRFWVQDNGIGISPQHIGKLFAVFQRLHTREEYAGTGIGLAIVKRAAERMNGRVGVESEEGKGSRFWVEFAAAK